MLEEVFLNYRKLRKTDLAALHCLDESKVWIGKQLRVGVAHFFIKNEDFPNLFPVFCVL